VGDSLTPTSNSQFSTIWAIAKVHNKAWIPLVWTTWIPTTSSITSLAADEHTRMQPATRLQLVRGEKETAGRMKAGGYPVVVRLLLDGHPPPLVHLPPLRRCEGGKPPEAGGYGQDEAQHRGHAVQHQPAQLARLCR